MTMFSFSGKSLPSSFGIGSGVGSSCRASRSGGAVVVWIRFNSPASCGTLSSILISTRPSPTKESLLVTQFFNASSESHTQDFNPGVSSVSIDVISLAMW
ncbi:hypothetical protein ACN38_g10874 [Penicillium nordicum]|uniref:Uncharacterized protein n=1 Tax=Penicillium nordicum TaxID=229535 RepID=A0A0M9WBM1_9EURO|nr:hypothetical protein ACN38_g10874 [Penicillium nordicum]